MISKEMQRKLESVEGVVLGETHCIVCGRKFTALSQIPFDKRNSSAMKAVVGKCPTNSPKHHAANEGGVVEEPIKKSIIAPVVEPVETPVEEIPEEPLVESLEEPLEEEEEEKPPKKPKKSIKK